MDLKPGQIIYEIPDDLSIYESAAEIDTACVVLQDLSAGTFLSVPLRFHSLIDNQVGVYEIDLAEFRATQREAIEAAVYESICDPERDIEHARKIASQLRD